jgi:hypothetical protein
MKCSRCDKDKPEIDFIRNGEIYKNCNKCNNERIQRYKRQKEGIHTVKELLSKRREIAFKKGNFVCCRCGEEKPLDNFTPDKTGRSKFGKLGFCHQCNSLTIKFSKIKKHYGLSKDDFIEILEEQNGKCKICSIDMETFSRGNIKANTLCVDHDHYTGKFRGLICNNCNRAIGLLDDSKENLLSAYKYLVAHDKQGELLETPEEDNQQPSLDSNILEGSTTNRRVPPINIEDSNSDTSALQQLDGKLFKIKIIGNEIKIIVDDIV